MQPPTKTHHFIKRYLGYESAQDSSAIITRRVYLRSLSLSVSLSQSSLSTAINRARRNIFIYAPACNPPYTMLLAPRSLFRWYITKQLPRLLSNGRLSSRCRLATFSSSIVVGKNSNSRRYQYKMHPLNSLLMTFHPWNLSKMYHDLDTNRDFLLYAFNLCYLILR